MTDNEIIKALECFAIDKDFDCLQCVGCAFETKGMCYENASEGIAKATLDLIKHQKAEIERLKKDNEYILMQHKFQRRPNGDCWNDVIEKSKAEAIKEFAERLKEIATRNSFACYRVDRMDIDNLVKEMTGE